MNLYVFVCYVYVLIVKNLPKLFLKFYLLI